LILRFLLTPDQLHGIGVTIGPWNIPAPGMDKAVDPHDRHVVELFGAAGLQQVEIHLAAAQHDPPDAGTRQGIRIAIRVAKPPSVSSPSADTDSS
jgi:hypothetical protein